VFRVMGEKAEAIRPSAVAHAIPIVRAGVPQKV
jgi:hypothetical protein